jgi:hypothetical protein
MNPEDRYRTTDGQVVQLLPLYTREAASRRWHRLWLFIPHAHDHVHPGYYRMWRCSRCWRAMHTDYTTTPWNWSPFSKQRIHAYKPGS